MTLNKAIKSYQSSQDGFTLIETAISVLIIAIILTMGMISLPIYLNKLDRSDNYERMDKVARAISIFSQRHNRVPCPADPRNAGPEPYGTERGAGATGLANIDTGVCFQYGQPDRRTGILPFITLGLEEDEAKDTYGNFFTYKVSITSANRRANERMSRWGATEDWYEAGGHVDPDKAMFCNGSIVNGATAGALSTTVTHDLQLTTPFGLVPGTYRNIQNYGGRVNEYIGGSYPQQNDAVLNGTFPPNYPAFALISHGRNAFGNFLSPLASVAQFLPAGATQLWNSDEEQANTTTNSNIVYVTDSVSYYIPNGSEPGVTTLPNAGANDVPFDTDDQVFFLTARQTYSYAGNSATCAKPRWSAQ